MYEGTRRARASDIYGIQHVLQPLEEMGALVKRSDEQLLEELDSFTVVERDGSIIACAALFPFYDEKCGEVAAIAVSPECRGHGQGDKLLGFRPHFFTDLILGSNLLDLRLPKKDVFILRDYIEKKAMSMGLERLFLLTTRAADWFVRRGFSQCTIDSIPRTRRAKINLSRGSKYYIKKLQPSFNGITVDNCNLDKSLS
eukprot:Gb_02774 [translate_table: standard]